MNAEERLKRYVDSTVDGVLMDLAQTGGGRNEAVRDASVRLGVFVAHNLLGESDATARLLEAARINGYVDKDGEREARSTILRSLRFGIAEGAMPDQLERILRDVASERSGPSPAPRKSNGARGDHVPPPDEPQRFPPPLEEVRALWDASSPVSAHPNAVEYLRGRGIDAQRLDDEQLARIAGDELPAWAGGWAGRLLVPLYDVRGSMRSLIARDVTGTADRKSRAPKGYGRKELVMGCGRAVRLLRQPEAARVVVCEGEIDFLVVATQRGDADESGALGFAAGSWSTSLAARIVAGSSVVIATDSDDAGEKYAAKIIETLKPRKVALSRWRGPDGLDVAKAGGLDKGTITPIDPNGWRSPTQRALELGANGADPMPTSFETLDRSTRGGLRPGAVVVLCGAPGAGKTSLAVQLARHYCGEGYPVGILACDEPADGLLVRWGQQEGLVRDELERGIYAARRHLAEQLRSRPLLLVDADESEAVLEDLAGRMAELARDIGKTGVLIVDSIQTARVREHIDDPGRTPRERVEAVVRALKHAARGLGLLVITTCEVARGLYRGGADPKINPLAAGKESSAIEYAANALLVLSNVAGESDLVDCAVPKNRIGGGRDPFRLKLDRDRARFEEVPVREEDGEDAREAEQEREDAREAKLEADAVKLLTAVLKARATGAELKSRHDVRRLAKGKNAWRNEVVSHLFATGRLMGGNGKPIGPPQAPSPTPDSPPDTPPDDDG